MGQKSRLRVRKVTGKERIVHLNKWEVTKNGAHLSGHRTKKLAEAKRKKLAKGY